ncbi:MAG: hypothetical protein KDD42_00220 [Bdellovibrionales bacterium]|nr:hypothetical protein [Bdellovibrionales bacterium]
MSLQLPDSYKLQFKRADIEKAIGRIALQVSEWIDRQFNEKDADLLAIPVLRGGIFFFADLIKEVQKSVEIAPVRAWAYESNQNAKQLSKIQISAEGIDVSGRRVLVLDDICDSGRTLKVIHEEFIRAGAREVRSAVLVKRIDGNSLFQPDWIGFEFEGPQWLVGYGMDDRERWRNLADIYIIDN